MKVSALGRTSSDGDRNGHVQHATCSLYERHGEFGSKTHTRPHQLFSHDVGPEVVPGKEGYLLGDGSTGPKSDYQS